MTLTADTLWTHSFAMQTPSAVGKVTRGLALHTGIPPLAGCKAKQHTANYPV